MGLQERLGRIDDAHQQLLQLYGVPNTEALRRAETLTLPDEIIAVTAADIDATQNDLHERWIFAGLDQNQPQIIRQGIGAKPLDPDTLAALGERPGRLVIEKVRNYLGTPIPLFLHNHPVPDREFFLKNPQGYTRHGMSTDTMTQLASAVAKHFSAGDMQHFDIYNRYYRSELAGSIRGYTAIVKPGQQLIQADPMPAYRYAYTESEATCKAIDTLSQGKFFSIKQFDDEMNAALVRYCEEKGFLAFQNNDYHSPILNRLI